MSGALQLYIADLHSSLTRDKCVVSLSATLQIYIPDRQHAANVCLRVYFPHDYPSHAAPLIEVTGPHLSDDMKASAVTELGEQFIAGCTC